MMIFTKKKQKKHVATFIAIPLSHIINCSLLTATVPSKPKIAKVVPIYKNGKHDDLYNYRPVSILPGFSKIMEMLIAHHSFFKKITFSEYQFGFTPGRNTTHDIITC